MKFSDHPMYAPGLADERTKVRAGVGVVIRDSRGWILLDRRSDSGAWAFPGGQIDPGESIAAAARREALEETGLEIKIERLIGVYSDPKVRIVKYPDGNVVHLVGILVEASIVSGILRPSAESIQLEFFDPAGPLPDGIAPPAGSPIRDAIAGVTGVIG